MPSRSVRLWAVAACVCALASSVTADPAGPSPSDDPRGWLDALDGAIKAKQTEISELYGLPAAKFMDLKWYDKDAKQAPLVSRLVRALALSGSFVIAVGGMSDVAGHGNLHSDAYELPLARAARPVNTVTFSSWSGHPLLYVTVAPHTFHRYPSVLRDALASVFETARVRFEVRNMAMGGVPSFPNSVCMEDNFGDDTDVVLWDFRMVGAARRRRRRRRARTDCSERRSKTTRSGGRADAIEPPDEARRRRPAPSEDRRDGSSC